MARRKADKEKEFEVDGRIETEITVTVRARSAAEAADKFNAMEWDDGSLIDREMVNWEFHRVREVDG